jgi:hypothetical protein
MRRRKWRWNMPRGGKRPGAGAPKGNMNALKHGRRSRQLAEVAVLLASDPNVRDTLLALSDKYDLKRRRASEVAAEILGKMLVRGLKRGADGRLIVQSPAHDGPTIKENRATEASAEPTASEILSKALTDNQKVSVNPYGQSENRYENPID